MRHRIFLVFMLSWVFAMPGFAADLALRESLHCREGGEGRDCTVANGRVDAERVAARNSFAFYVFGGPAMPQEPLEILRDEYTKAGIEVWWLGDMPQFDRDPYYRAFNQRMEQAIDARHGPGAIRKVYDRIEARMKAAEARAKATPARAPAR